MCINIDMEAANNYERKAATVLLFNQGKVLSVSRKNDATKKGLPGGKVDPGETFLEAAIRETKEETGLDAYFLIPIFHRYDGEYYTIAYLGQWKGNITKTSDNETGVVEWVDFEELRKGQFGDYNTELEIQLSKLGLYI